jgi:4'-phosphopantetheinyl transferase
MASRCTGGRLSPDQQPQPAPARRYARDRGCDRLGQGSCRRSCEGISDQLCDRRRDQIHWLSQDLADLPPSLTWLSAVERQRLDGLSVEKRRRDFLLGRWTAKQLVAAVLWPVTPPQTELSVRAAADGAPEAFIGERTLPLSLSISHSAGRALAVVRIISTDIERSMAASSAFSVGADIEHIEPRSQLLVDDFFTPQESAQVASSLPADRDRLITVLWSAKESVLKALRCGLREDPRHLHVQVEAPLAAADTDWHPIRVSVVGTQHLHAGALTGWWRVQGRFALTIISHCALGLLPVVDRSPDGKPNQANR